MLELPVGALKMWLFRPAWSLSLGSLSPPRLYTLSWTCPPVGGTEAALLQQLQVPTGVLPILTLAPVLATDLADSWEVLSTYDALPFYATVTLAISRETLSCKRS